MSVRLIAIDIDFTLLDDDLRIIEENKRAIKRVIESGRIVTLATGRMFRSARPFAEELGLDVPLITYNGALVKSALSEEVFYHMPLEWEMAYKLVRRAAEKDIYIGVYIDDELIVSKECEESRYYCGRSGVDAMPVGDLTKYLDRNRDADVTKVLYISFGTEKVDQFEASLRSDFGGSIYIARSLRYYIEAMNIRVSKGNALRALGRRFGIPREEIMAIGDSYNDIEMIEYAGVGVAVGNAPDEVKRRADFVAPSNNERGVAEAIERYVLKDRIKD